MTRKQAIENIKYEVAKHGKITAEATRIFIENRISREVFNNTVKEGLYKFNNP